MVYMAMVFLIFPLLAIIPVSFTPKRFLSMPSDELSLRHYEALATSPEWLGSIWQSLMVATLSAVLATVLAVLFALGIWYRRPRLTPLLIGFVILPMAVPPIISAIVLYFFETRMGLYDTLPGVILAHTVIVVPYAVITVLVVLSQLDRRIERAARNLGASLWQTTVFVILPNIKVGIASAGFLAFVLSWEEIAITLFVTSFDVITLPRRIWSGLRDNIDPVIASVSVVLIALTVAAVLVRTVAVGMKARRNKEASA